METDEHGILTQEAITEIAFREAKRAEREKDWRNYRPGLAIAQAMKDHDVAVVKKVPNPYDEYSNMNWKVFEDSRSVILAALKAGSDG